MSWDVLEGDCLEVLKELPDQSVHCVVTSPPSWAGFGKGPKRHLGLEPTPEKYVSRMVEIFGEVRRILRDEGTLWLNIGDTYEGRTLAGIPWRVAFALQEDGWYLRSDIIWSKPDPRQEEVFDRPISSHQYLFLFTKRPRYFYDGEAIKERSINAGKSVVLGDKSLSRGQALGMGLTPEMAGGNATADAVVVPEYRNRRSVWQIPHSPALRPDFDLTPYDLIVPCIEAGTSEHGCCSACGAPWTRQTKREGGPPPGDHRQRDDGIEGGKTAHATGTLAGSHLSNVYKEYGYATIRTTGWEKSCSCDCPDSTMPCTVLDPFAGTGTIGLIATRFNRSYLGIELLPEYVKESRLRIEWKQMTMGLLDAEYAEQKEMKNGLENS